MKKFADEVEIAVEDLFVEEKQKSPNWIEQFGDFCG
jgi:hypothetical protein